MALSEITTERLRLVPWDVAQHTAGLAAVNAEPAAVRYLNDGIPYTREETDRQSARFAAHWDEHGFGLWAAIIADTSSMIGFVGLSHPRGFPQLATEVEVGWRLHPRAWGHGYATEGARAALHAAADLSIRRVIAIIDPANTPSIAVATRLGMTPGRRLAHPQRPGTVTIFETTPG